MIRYDMIVVDGVPTADLPGLVEQACGSGRWVDGRNSRRFIGDDDRFIVDVNTIKEFLMPVGDKVEDQRRRALAVFDALVKARPDAGFELVAEDDSVIRNHPAAA